MKTLVYLHGFGSSPGRVEGAGLSEYVLALPVAARPQLHVPALTDRPALAIASVAQWVERHADRAALTFVGSSLGGYYATHLAERYGARAVMINPAVRPYDDLQAWRGVQTNLYTGAAFDVTDRTSLFASVTNLTDQEYNVAFRPAGARPGAPRSWLAGVKLAF